MLAIRRILHPTDFSDSSQTAFEVACALARDYDAELVLCYVEPWPAVPVVDGIALDVPADDADADVSRLADVRPEDPAVRVVRRLRRGEAAHEILTVAADAAVDLIVMGTHGRGGLPRLVLGSVAESVMRKAPCPVLTVRTPAHAAHAPATTAAAAAGG
ncbi:universal stress protein [bacterium]|nr:universal stress protein [bacterium]